MCKKPTISLIAMIFLVVVICVCLIIQAPIAHYKEKSMQQRDESEVYEIGYSIMLCADNDVFYDELIPYVAENNIGGYMNNMAMHGMTITFKPDSENKYVLGDGQINLLIGDGEYTVSDCSAVYEMLTSTFGESITMQSKKYQSAKECTIFLHFINFEAEKYKIQVICEFMN